MNCSLILSFLICISLAFQANAKFNNVVEYPKSFKDSVYKFELVFDEGLSMSVFQEAYREFDPVVYDTATSQFYLRNKSLSAACDQKSLLTDQKLIDTIVTVDGRHRYMVLVNDQFPGPPIVVPKNARVEIKVVNNLRAETLSVHWHGQTQKNTFQMDGVNRITQCPIAPGEFMIYKFIATDVGTHWYHSHSSVQRTDGAVGAFIVVENPEEDELKNGNLKSIEQIGANTNKTNTTELRSERASKYEQEFYFFVQDWQYLHSEDAVQLPLWGNGKFWNGFNESNECFYPVRIADHSMMMIKPDSFIINGKGWYDLPDKLDKLNAFANRAKRLPLEKFSVQPNKRYLFRVIGSNMGFPIVVSVNDHKINLVATDGNPIVPINDLDYLIINGGERYDFELVTKETSNQNFFIIIEGLASYDWNFKPLTVDHYGIAILNYADSNDLRYIPRACSNLAPCMISNCPYLPRRDGNVRCVDVAQMQSPEYKISPNEKEKLFKRRYAESEFEEHFFNFHFSGPIKMRSSVNGKQYSMPRMPPFFSSKFEDSITGMECPSTCTGEQTCHCSSRTQITPGKVIQFVLYNMGKGAGVEGTAHPIHLHGHHFYVLDMGYPEYNASGVFLRNNREINCKQDDSEYCNAVGWSSTLYRNGNIPNGNFEDPPRKDTIIVPVGGYAVIRFLADNIGFWFMHCHIEIHATEGMATLIQEGTQEQIRQVVDWTDMHTCFKGFDRPKNAKSHSSKLEVNWILGLVLLSAGFISAEVNY